MASEAPSVTPDMEVCGPVLWTRLEVAVEARGDSATVQAFFHSADGGHLQEGPTCGFVALFLAAKSAGLIPTEEHVVNVVDALAWARMVGFSNLGEMFSVEWLSHIGKSFYHLGTFTPTTIPTACDLISAINAGKVFIVPYDCDKNFEPTNRNGEGAHWAAVVGYAIFSNDCLNVEKNAPPNARIFFAQLKPTESLTIEADELFVIAYQGKSRHPALWKYTTLRDSNLQLTNADSKRASQFRLPAKTVDDDFELHALRGKSVLVEKRE